MSVKQVYKKFILLAVFGIPMGLMEAIIVVYLRKLYYPQGFTFPLKSMPGELLVLEIVREACTIVMLVVIAWLAGKTAGRDLPGLSIPLPSGISSIMWD